jgi:hypothetical protein
VVVNFVVVYGLFISSNTLLLSNDKRGSDLVAFSTPTKIATSDFVKRGLAIYSNPFQNLHLETRDSKPTHIRRGY